ncbi:phosphoribosylglycinamide formyltransferase [Paenibacillus popilliae]|uniref:Phosphoribosylglycinamide formyltransferase n=1 Tax=Paenibacillus popilliae ATCC 14706 TaxID=1212764 RepID=M9M4R5_PAEPP|nr:phosphoribosylglycinamide formyltransferase [Paenibacillus popilliae]GAC44089.1 folate-dependent phosphoribosylglycinamide formyltransferase [Paenibacillus popilliae ATCC 14706]
MRTGCEGQEAEYAGTAGLEIAPSSRTSSLPRIAVFASGSGSNFQALAEASRAGQLGGEVALIVCDKPGARVLERARDAGVPAAVFEPKRYESRGDYERDVLRMLSRHSVQWIALAGYIRLVTPVLLEAYEGRILNIHPSLLPSFPGLNAVRQALDYGVKVTGVTVHQVDAGMDTGLIVGQEAVAIATDDTFESLLAKIQAVEHRIYPQVLRSLLTGPYTGQRAGQEDEA